MELRKPKWLKAPLPAGETYFRFKRELSERRLNTICQSARCPNAGDCWNRGHATFLILGDVCTRRCRFCSVSEGTPTVPDPGEAERILEMAGRMNLRYAVITSVTRDDLPDKGSGHYANVLRTLKQGRPQMRVEVLIPDFSACREHIDRVLEAGPDVVAHNIETVRSLYPHVDREAGAYDRSLSVLAYTARRGAISKSGLMVGLGESRAQLDEVFDDLVRAGVKLLTIGQYLKPQADCAPVSRYYPVDEFTELKKTALDRGLRAVAAGPLVRSSYDAESLFQMVNA